MNNNVNLVTGEIVEIKSLNFNFNNFLISKTDFVKNFGKNAPRYGNHPYNEINTRVDYYVVKDTIYRTPTANGLLVETKQSGYELVKVKETLWSNIKSAVTNAMDCDKPIVDEIIGDLYEAVYVSTEPEFTLDGKPIPKELGLEIESAHRKGLKYVLDSSEFTMNYED